VKTVVSCALGECVHVAGVSYRLTPENGERLLAEFAEAADELHSRDVRFVFGGTPSVVKLARKLNCFRIN